MSHFSPEREEEIYQEISDWWDDMTWAQRVDQVDPGGTGEFIRLLEFAEETQENRDLCRILEGGSWRYVYPERWDDLGHVLEALSAYLYNLAESRGVIEEQVGERLTHRRS